MLTRAALLWMTFAALMGFAVGGSVVWSSKPFPAKEQNADGNQKPKTKSDAQYPEVQSLWLPTDSVGLYTLVLCVFTGILAGVSIFQGVMLLRSDKTSRVAAEAAKLNAQALIDAERAHLFAVIDRDNLSHSIGPVASINFANRAQGGGGIWDDDAYVMRPALSFFLKNLGKTPAIITQFSGQLRQGDSNQRMWDYGMVAPLYGVVEGAANSQMIQCELDDSLFTVGQAKLAMNGTRPLYFYGHATFLDSFNRTYTYYWRFENMGVNFFMTQSEEKPEA